MADEPLETISVSVFKATCLGVLKKVHETGRPILVTRRGAPVAQIGPAPQPAGSTDRLGSMKGTGRILGDIVSPLDEPWEALED